MSSSKQASNTSKNSMTDIQITVKSGAQVLIPTVNYSTDSTSSAANKSAGEGNGSGLEAGPSVAGQDHNPGQESTSQVAGIESSELGRPLNHEYGIGREGTMGLPGTLLSSTPNSGISVGGEILGQGNQHVGHSRPVASMVGLSQPNAPKGGLSAELEFSPSFYLSMRRKALCIISFIPCRKGDFPEDDDVFATSADQDLAVRPKEVSNKVSLKYVDQTRWAEANNSIQWQLMSEGHLRTHQDMTNYLKCTNQIMQLA